MYNPQEIRRIIKRDAMNAVKDNLKINLIFFGVYGLFYGIFDFWLIGKGAIFDITGVLAFLLQLMLLAPALMGQRAAYLSMIRKEKVMASKIFGYYTKDNYPTALIVVGFFKLLEFVLSLFCVYLVVMATIMIGCYLQVFWSLELIPYYFSMNIFKGVWSTMSRLEVFFLIGLLFSSVFITFGIKFAVKVFLSRYICAYNLAIDHPNGSLSALFAKSRSIMRGKTVDMLWFYFSFWPWLIVVPLTLGLALFWAVPYFFMCETLYVEYFRDCYEKNRSTEFIELNEIR